MEDTKESILKSSERLMGDVIYTVVFDTCNEMIAQGIDQEKVLECANKVVNNYLEGGIKVRKKPAPRKAQPKAASAAKDKPIDVLKAAHKKLHSLTDNVVWIDHPHSTDYSYTTSVKLVKGYPVRNNKTQKIEMVVNDEETCQLTINDVKVAMGLGFEVDYDNVQQ
jgi:hypothetical protein